MNGAAGALAEQYETAKAEYDTLLADKLRASMRLSSLLRLRADSVNEDQKQEMGELTDILPALDKSIDLLSPVVTAAAAALRDSSSYGRGAPGGLTRVKGTLKFPTDLLKFEHDKTIIPEFFDHTETTLVTHNMPPSQWVLALMHQCREEPAAMKWVKTNIFNANLDWEHAKAKFTDKFEVVSAEERQLEILFRLDYRKCKSSNEHLERIRSICENTGIDHDQFWVVTLAMVTLNPRVVSLVKFAKQPKVKLTWDGLVEAVAAAEHRIVHDLSLPLPIPTKAAVQTPTEADVQRRLPQVKNEAYAAVPVVPSGSGDAGPAKERRKEWLATATCHTCGQTGHISPNCPQKRPRREPAASGQRGPSGAFFVGEVAADDAAASVDVDQELADMLAIEPTFGLFMLAEVEDDGPADSSSPHALEESKDAAVPGSMEVPLMIGGKKTWAFVDTGSASSLYNLTFVEANTGLFHTPDGASGPAFAEAFNGQTSPLGRPVVCRHLQFGSRVVSNLTCRTSPFPVGAQRCSLLLGRDQFASFGIGVTGIPTDFPCSPHTTEEAPGTDSAGQYEIDNAPLALALFLIFQGFLLASALDFTKLPVVCYVDDIITFTKTSLLEQIEQVKAGFQLLTQYNQRPDPRECLQYNIGKSGFYPARSLLATEPFDTCAIDTAGPYKTSPHGYNYFFVYTCLCTRFVHVIPAGAAATPAVVAAAAPASAVVIAPLQARPRAGRQPTAHATPSKFR